MRRIGKRLRVRTSDLISDSLGRRTKMLSKVRSLTHSRSMDSTSPVVPPTWMTSPISNGRSKIRNSPLTRFEAEVCEAKPTATDSTPAAPSSTPSWKPSWCIAATANRPSVR